MKRATIMLLLLALIASVGLAQDMAELEVDHNVNAAYVTPHTAWATPYVQGKTRVLFFLDGRGTNPREVIELKQRFDFDPQMIFWARIVDSTQEQWHGAENGIRRMARLLNQKWDCYVFIDISPDKVPVEQQYPIFKAVTEGAGLVVLGTNDKRVLKDKNKLAELPAFISDVAGAEAFSIMQGRGVRLPARPAIEYGPGWETAYDEWDMRFGKAILWAAGKEPKVSLTLTPRGEQLARATLPGMAAALQWQNGAGVADVTLRREDGQSIALPQQALRTAEGAANVQIPLVRAGNYHLDVIARDGKNVTGFASVPLTVVDELEVTELTLDRNWAEIGETITGSVALSKPLAANQSLLVQIFDSRGREIHRIPNAPWGAGKKFELKVPATWPMLVRVQATLMDKDNEVSSAWQFARVVKRHRGQHNFVMWDTPKGNLAPVAQQALTDAAVTVQLRGGTPEPVVAATDTAWIPYTTRIMSRSKDANGVMKPVCWNDEAGIQAYVDGIVGKYVESRQHGVFVYSLGDEVDVRGSCLSPYCLEAYRKYLEEQYGNIAALNASWGSTYKSFDEVQLSKPDDNEEAEALRAGNFPRWYDRQAFQSYNFCKLCERFGEGFRRIDPDSLCGFEGAGTFRSGDDLDGFVRSNTFWSPYPGTADEVLRSIAPRDFPRANWIGYTKDADTLLEKYWRIITRGCDAVWWWRWDCIGRFHGWLAPNLDPFPAVQEILKDTQIVRDGLGDLLLKSEMETDGVGILYSQPAAYAAQVQSSNTFGAYEASHSAFHSALRENGLNFLYFTDRQMRLDEVDLSKFKVIILPMIQAMGEKEAGMFRQYVQNGGTLIADIRPATFDGHVKPLAAGQLDDVFGIKRPGFAEAVVGDGQLRLGEAQVALQKIRVDGNVSATTAQANGAAGEAPLLLINNFGKGRAILMNLAMATFPSLSTDSTPEDAAAIIRSLLQGAQVTPAVQLVNDKGQRVRNVEVTRWMNGPVQIVSILRHQGNPEKAKLSLPQGLYAYDLKSGKELGRQQAINLTITPYRAMFFALSPQPLKPVEVKAAASVRPGEMQHLQIVSAMPQGDQGVKVEVKLPDGTVADWVDGSVVTNKQGVTVDVPVAFNDPKGTWTVNVTDAYTGKTASTRFSVK